MQDRTFTPATVTVEPGTTVTWTNDSDREHTVTADEGSFDSGTLPSGATFTQAFEQEGSFGYFCALHGGMRGTVQVGTGGQEDTGGAPTPTPAPATGEPGGDVEVQVADFAFEPDALEVQPGTTVTWLQGGDVPHTVTADDGTFDSGTLPSGETFSHTFDEPGTYGYVCELHPQMVAAVTVAGAAEADPPDLTTAGATAGQPRDAQPRASPTRELAASSLDAPVTVPLGGLLLLLTLLVSVAVLAGAWRIERALHRAASQAAPRPARQPPART
jgi:plastocyanin